MSGENSTIACECFVLQEGASRRVASRDGIRPDEEKNRDCFPAVFCKSEVLISNEKPKASRVRLERMSGANASTILLTLCLLVPHIC